MGSEAHPQKEAEAGLVVALVTRTGTKTSMKSIASMALEGHVSGLAWLSTKEILVASGKMPFHDQYAIYSPLKRTVSCSYTMYFDSRV